MMEQQSIEPNGAQSGGLTPKLVSDLTPQGKDLLSKILDCLDSNKAEEIVSLPLAGKSAMADYMVVASGTSTRHVSALADYILRMLKESGLGRCRVEGMARADWVLIDAGDVIVHIFRPEVRQFYNLEKMWSIDMVEPGDTRQLG